MKTFIVALASLYATSALAIAGGSIQIDDLTDLLQQKPEIAKVIKDLDVNIGVGTRLGNDTAFGGARIGPYIFTVAGAVPGQLVIHTTATAEDATGKSVSLSDQNAASLHEALNGIELKLGRTP